jgi:hypothetical protein
MASSVPPSVPGSSVSPTGPTSSRSEIKVISHSDLFYWWPVWVLAFFMAAWTAVENHRLAIVPKTGLVTQPNDSDGNPKKGEYQMTFQEGGVPLEETQSLKAAVINGKSGQPPFPTRVSQHAWLGPVFLVGLVLTMLITNVPMRGLLSFIVIILIVVFALLASLFKIWDDIFEAFGNLRIYINMAGYLFIGVTVFVCWLLATFVFDRRTYVIFTPGQIRVCEHIGASVQTYNTMGVSLEKQRDDLFRHYILGFGSGDLILHVPSANKQSIRLPNVLFIGWRLREIENMLRSVATTRD